MKNLILTFDTIDVEDFTFERFSDIPTIPNSILEKVDYYTFVETSDDEKIEYISYDLYGTSEYWDIILILNNMKDPLSLPKSLDFIINKVDKKIKEYIEYYKIKDDNVYKERYSYELGIEQKENEKFRMVKVVKPEKLVNFLRDLRKANIG